MSRPSAESKLNVVHAPLPRALEPPATLTQPQRELWVTCTSSKPFDWFPPDSAPILLEYVRAVSMADELEGRIREAVGADDVKSLRPLLEMRDRESKRVIAAATKLRLTQQ